MPLRPGKSEKVVGENIDELVSMGYSRQEAIRIALREAGVHTDFKGRVDRRMTDSPPRG